MPRVSRKRYDHRDEPGSSLELDFAWRAHDAIQDVIYYVDQKASYVLIVATAVGGLAASEVFSSGGALHSTSGLKLWTVRVMGLLFTLAVILALSVVLPQLRRGKAAREAQHGLVYFGHLRHRAPEDIARAFSRLDTGAASDLLAAELHAISKIAWSKHVRLQSAVIALVAGTSCLVVALVQ
jgi:hypothetical protein